LDKVELAKRRWKMRILYVDDNIYMRQTVKNMLSYLGYPNLVGANDGLDAWRILSSENVEMVLADLDMPKIDGVHLLMKMREDRKLRNIPFILISGNLNKESVHLAGEFEADGILIKPFDINKLRDVIIKSFEKRITPNKEREIIWEGEDALADQDIEKLTSVVKRLETLKASGKSINIFKYLVFKAFGALMMKQYEQVRQILIPAVEKNPYIMKAYDVIAESFKLEGELSSAIEYMKKGILLSPGNLDRIITALEYADEADDNREMLELLTILSDQITNFDEEVYKKLFNGYSKLGEWEKIGKLYTRLVKDMDAKDVPYIFHKTAVNAFLQLDEKDKPIDIFSKLLKSVKKKSDTYPFIMMDYGHHLHAMGKEGEGVAVLKKLVELYPEFAEKNSVEAKIKKLQPNE